MAAVTIYDKSGVAKTDSNGNYVTAAVKYVAQTMKLAYIETTVNSPYPISWNVGDYILWGENIIDHWQDVKFVLFNVPQPTKVAEAGTYGGGFTYSGIQFFDAAKCLEMALFTDMQITNDNLVFFSNRESLSTFEDVAGIQARIQACIDFYMSQLTSTDPFYGYTFQVQLNNNPNPALGGEDATAYTELIAEARQFSFSDGENCVEALDAIGEVWPVIGWNYYISTTHSVVYVYIGNINFVSNSTVTTVYDTGSTYTMVLSRHNGLVDIKKYVTNQNEFCTVLIPYGSDRNLITRYYNKADVYNSDGILNGQSDDLPCLMLPISQWGTTNGKWDWSSNNEATRVLPDPRKALIADSTKVAKYGPITKVVRFDNDQEGDIYPSIVGVTIQDLWDAMSPTDTYYPDTEGPYQGPERVDEIMWGYSIADDGVLSASGEAFTNTTTIERGQATQSATISASGTKVWTKLLIYLGDPSWEADGVSITSDNYVISWPSDDNLVPTSVNLYLDLFNSGGTRLLRLTYDALDKLTKYIDANGDEQWSLLVDGLFFSGVESYLANTVEVNLLFEITLKNESASSISATIDYPAASLRITNTNELAPTCKIDIPQIGFNLTEQLSDNDGYGTINMNTGMCAGRSFKIIGCKHVLSAGSDDYWQLTLQRETDASTGMVYPNSKFPIADGDRYVITDIQMPELYINTSATRLYNAAYQYYERNSQLRYLYDLTIDSKYVYKYTVGRQYPFVDHGYYVAFSDADLTSGQTVYILVDTVTITVGEDNIPTFKLTMRERLSLPVSTQ